MMPSLNVLTYNIRKGKGASGRLDGSVTDLAAALAPHTPDVLLCQEVSHHHNGSVDQSRHLAQLLGVQPYYGANKQRRTGHHGNATFTRHHVTQAVNHDISTNALERRGVLYVSLDLDGRPVHLFNAHLGLNNRQRHKQIEQIAEIIHHYCGQRRETVVLAGDFNDWNRRIGRLVTTQLGFTDACAHLSGRAAYTWHARRPLFNLDRVYVRHATLHSSVRFSGAPWTQLSDHLPLAVRIDLP